VTIGSGVSEGAGVEFPTFPLTCVVVLKTLWHYRASVWSESQPEWMHTGCVNMWVFNVPLDKFRIRFFLDKHLQWHWQPNSRKSKENT